MIKQVCKFICYLFLVINSTNVLGNEAVPITLESVRINTSDIASLLRGAKFYAQNCMVCHTMRYISQDSIARKAGITLDKMPLKQKEWWLNIVPPDLTLIARQYSAAWLYTYLHSFYKDSARPTGYNNLLVKDINMPNPFIGMQGEQILNERGKQALMSGKNPHYYSVLELVKMGSMTPEQFDATTADLVNFLVYIADPERPFRLHLGIIVILFLILFFVLTYLLKKAFWRDVPRDDK